MHTNYVMIYNIMLDIAEVITSLIISNSTCKIRLMAGHTIFEAEPTDPFYYNGWSEL